MWLPASQLNKLAIAAAVLTCLMSVSACASRTVIGRASRPASEGRAAAKVPAKTAEPKASPAKPAEKKPEQTAKVEAKPAPAGMGMGTALPAARKDASDTTQMSSPAKPAAEKAGAQQDKPSPYKLDLSFGGFGLGVGLFDTPVAVAVDEQENIYVVDQGNYRIEKFDQFGIFQFAFGKQGMGDGEFVEETVGGVTTLRMTGEFEFNKPIGIHIENDDNRNLLRMTVVDSLNYRLRRLLLTKSTTARFPDDVFILLERGFGNKPDTALKDIYDSENRQVILDPIFIDEPSGKADKMLLAPFVWGGMGFAEGQLNLPTYLAKDDAGTLYVSDTANGRVEGFYVTPNDRRTDATFFREWGNNLDQPYGAGRLNEPTAVAFDSSGFGGFLVLDKLRDGGYNIQRFDKEGKFLGVFASSGDKEGQFRQPVSIAVNPFENTVFVTDRGRKKVMVYNNKGDFMFEFGGEELSDPRGIAVIRNNFVYVTDAVKNMVYRYVPQ